MKTKTICYNCECEVDDTTTVDSENWCLDCAAEESFLCDNCHECHHIDNRYNVDGENWCMDCVENSAFCCDNCGEYFHTDNSCVVQDDSLCECCANMKAFYCNNCDSYYYNRNGIYCEAIGESLCRDCYHENWTHCECCECEIHVEDLYDGMCESCYNEEEDNNSIIHNYNYKPHPEFSKLPQENNPLFYGIELEVESTGDSGNEDIAESLPTFVYCKEDCSLNDGFEIVSHPASYKWLKEHINNWSKILDIRKAGFLSSKTDTCGMHVHIDKKYFTEKHLYRFLRFFYENPNFIMFISGRSEGNFNRWSSLRNDCDKSIEYKAKYKEGNCHRDCAVNLYNRNTIEIRIFKGTLFPRSFWKNIEFLESVVRYSKAKSCEKMTEKEYLEYIGRTKKMFPNLYGWLKDKGKICV